MQALMGATSATRSPAGLDWSRSTISWRTVRFAVAVVTVASSEVREAVAVVTVAKSEVREAVEVAVALSMDGRLELPLKVAVHSSDWEDG